MEIDQLHKKKKIYPNNEINHCDENLSLWWKFIAVMNIYHCDENLSLRRKFIAVMKIFFDNL